MNRVVTTYRVVTGWLQGGYRIVTGPGGYRVVTEWLHGGYRVATVTKRQCWLHLTL